MEGDASGRESVDGWAWVWADACVELAVRSVSVGGRVRSVYWNSASVFAIFSWTLAFLAAASVRLLSARASRCVSRRRAGVGQEGSGRSARRPLLLSLPSGVYHRVRPDRAFDSFAPSLPDHTLPALRWSHTREAALRSHSSASSPPPANRKLNGSDDRDVD